MTLIIQEKFKYFKKNNLEVFFKLNSGEFRNGYVKDFKGNIFIIDERVLGEILIHINEINPKSIQRSRKK